MNVRRGVAGVVAAALVATGITFVASANATTTQVAANCGDAAVSPEQALSVAAACGHEVVVASSQTEVSRVLAKPSGELLFESAVVPQWTRRADGQWVDVDLTLQRAADGSWRPAASAADVRFGAGGTAEMVTLVRDGKRLTMSWPGRLPEPSVSGSEATYPDVLPGVDLVMRATETGFSHVLVVKTAQAATHEALRAVRLDIDGDVTVDELPDGSLRAIAGDQVLATAQPAAMWDSTLPKGMAPSSEESSSAAGPGDYARVATVDAEVTEAGDIVLVPDPELLSSGATYPVYVDPAWSTGKSRWAYATSNGSNNTDYSVARVGRSPDNGVLYRSFFEFPTTAGSVTIKGKHIRSAYVQMKLDHSWSCGDTWVHMYLTPVINATMRASWSGMKLRKWLGAEKGHANEAGGCGVIQPDMIMNFDGSTVTSQVQTAANDRWSTITIGFCACNEKGEYESTQDRWKKFFPNSAKLIVEYDSIPGAPTDLQAAGVACGTNPITIGTTTPYLSAIYPDEDTGQTLSGTYEWVEVPADGSITDATPRKPAPPPAPAVANQRGQTVPLSGLTSGKRYAFRVRATDPAPYSKTGPWSSWCHFIVDTTAPRLTVSVVSMPAGPGQPGVFRLESPDPDVTKFRYGWSGASIEVAAPSTGTKFVELTLTAPKYGRTTLHAAAVDATGFVGNASTEFTVGRPALAVAQWGLQTYPGVTPAQALADQQAADGQQTPLTATNLSWVDGSRLVGGQTAGFNGESTVLTAPTSVVDTAGSFSVAAWVKAESMPGCGAQAVASIADPDSAFSPFVLGLNCSTNTWWFRVADREAGSVVYADVASSQTATLGRWTHLAGVWDEPEQTLKLYVDGVLSASVTPSASWLATRSGGWTANGQFVIGRARVSGADKDPFRGELADVQAFNRALVDHDFTGQLATDPDSGDVNEPGIVAAIEVGRWDFNTATPCYSADLADTCEAADGGAWSRWMALSRGTSLTVGPDGGAALDLDACYFPEENGGVCEATQEYGRSATKTGLDTTDPSYPKTMWRDAPVLRTDQSFTVSAWVVNRAAGVNHTVLSAPGAHESAFALAWDATGGGRWTFTVTDEDGAGSARAVVASPVMADPDGAWAHVVAVYDAARAELRLYVDGKLVGRETLPFTPLSSTNALQVGRALTGGSMGGYWTGGIDDVLTWQGALSDGAVAELYAAQNV